MEIIWFVAGGFVGALIGVMAMSLCVISKHADAEDYNHE